MRKRDDMLPRALRRVVRDGALAVTLGGVVLVSFASAAHAEDSPSDSRAAFSGGNITTCDAAGFGGDTQVGADSHSASDGNIQGTVQTNQGTVQRGNGQELNVAIQPGHDSVQVDAVVVKGGNGYNSYTDQTYLPPKLQPDQHYISPLNGGSNVPDISHWFVCYNTNGTKLPAGGVGSEGVAGVAALGLGSVTVAARRRRRRRATA
jgi:hypothetical protein